MEVDAAIQDERAVNLISTLGNRRALALLERAAAGAPRRRGPLRRVGLIAGHYFWSVLCLATFLQCGEQWSGMCVQLKAGESQRDSKQSQHPHDSRPGARRLQGALPLDADAVDRKEQTPHRRAVRALQL